MLLLYLEHADSAALSVHAQEFMLTHLQYCYSVRCKQIAELMLEQTLLCSSCSVCRALPRDLIWWYDLLPKLSKHTWQTRVLASMLRRVHLASWRFMQHTEDPMLDSNAAPTAAISWLQEYPHHHPQQRQATLPQPNDYRLVVKEVLHFIKVVEESSCLAAVVYSSLDDTLMEYPVTQVRVSCSAVACTVLKAHHGTW